MATDSDLILEVRDMLGESVASFWTDTELKRHLVQSIRKVRDAVPLDALLKLREETVTYASQSPDSSGEIVTVLLKPTVLYKLIEIVAIESDGSYGFPWDYVSEKEYWRIRRDEDNSAQDSTDTRIFTERQSSTSYTYQYWMLYPYPYGSDVRYVRISYIAKPSESGTMTLPTDDPNLQYLAVMDVVAKAAAKKSRDLELASWARNEFNSVMSVIRHDYTNKYGLTQSVVCTIG